MGSFGLRTMPSIAACTFCGWTIVFPSYPNALLGANASEIKISSANANAIKSIRLILILIAAPSQFNLAE